METEKYYFRIGVFMLLTFGAFAFYLSTINQEFEKRSFVRYSIYFSSAVTGLDQGAPVKLKGIDVGRVVMINFDATQNDRIHVISDIYEDAPIREDTIATLEYQGITGTSYIALSNRGTSSDLMKKKPPEGEKYPVIQSRQSELQAVLSGAPEVMGRFARVADQATKLLSDENIDSLEELVPEVRDTLAETRRAMREFKMLARTLREDPSVLVHSTKYQGYELDDTPKGASNNKGGDK